MARSQIGLFISSIVILVVGVAICASGEFRVSSKYALSGAPSVVGGLAVFGVSFIAIGLIGLYRFGKTMPGGGGAEENGHDREPFPGDEPHADQDTSLGLHQ